MKIRILESLYNFFCSNRTPYKSPGLDKYGLGEESTEEAIEVAYLAKMLDEADYSKPRFMVRMFLRLYALEGRVKELENKK